MKTARALVLVCLAGLLGSILTVVHAPAVQARTLSADPAPVTCPADATRGTWCLGWDNYAGGPSTEPIGTFTVHLNSHSDTSISIPVPGGGVTGNAEFVHNTVMGGDLRDVDTNQRVDTGRRVLVDWQACAVQSSACTWTFLKENYPKPPPSSPAFPPPTPVWLFWQYSYLSANHCCTVGSTGFAIKVVYDEGGDETGPQPPTAAFTATADPSRAGRFAFASSSTDPAGGPLVHAWDFGDGTTGVGTVVLHDYATPGTYPVTLKVTNEAGRTDTETHDVVVAAPTLSVVLKLLDDAAPPLDPEADLRVRTTVSASADGVGALSGLRFGAAPVVVGPASRFDVTGGPEPVPDPAGFALDPGGSTEFVTTLTPAELGAYTLSTSVAGTDAAGRVVTATASTNGVIGRALEVTIGLDPPHVKQKEEGEDPEPVDVAVVVKLRNTTDEPMTDVNLRSLRVDRTAPGQLLDVVQKDGVEPDPFTGFDVGTLAPGETRELDATFTANDDAEAEFEAIATGTTSDDASVTGRGTARWSVEPTYLLRVATSVTQPVGATLLPAGRPIVVQGYVKNLSSTAALDLGSLYPVLDGNAGIMSLAYDDVGTDPRDLVAPGSLHLDPGESQSFTVKVMTGYSDPKGTGDVNRSGGTRATLDFTPWGSATLADGTVADITPEQIKSTPEDLQRAVSIDDSIPIPTLGPAGYLAVGGGIMVGGVEGVYSAVVATVRGAVELAKLPYTAIVATSEYQSKVWATFTPEEKDAFATESSYLIVAVLLRNAELGHRDAAELLEQVKATTLQGMTDMENDWRVGDYAQTARLYARFGSDAIAQVAMPWALAKLAKSPNAAAALTKFQDAIQTRMHPVLAELASIDRVQAMAPLLEIIESGTELTPAEIERLYGISQEELAELKRIATKYKFLLTVRSRHASSLEWIEKAGALLKPEALKIKSVSELDSRLGYRESDIGSLVFKKPEVLIEFEKRPGDIVAITDEYLQSKGFTPGTPDYANGSKRIADRIEEWVEWEATYKAWDKRKWIDVSFNYKGNAVDDTIRKGTGQYRGFKLEPIGPEGSEEYVVKMLDGSTNRFVPVTGDIDAIAFTHIDGSPLSALEHAELLDELRTNPFLKAPHGESATYTRGGISFIAKQFKPGEAGLQIAPFDAVPRAVRFSTTKSVWKSPFDYNLHWEGGFVNVGESFEAAPFPLVDPRLGLPRRLPVMAPATKPIALPGRPVGAAPNVGRCRFAYSTAADAEPLLFAADGSIVEVVDGTLEAWAADPGCFDEGPVVEIAIRPSTEVPDAVAAGTAELPVRDEPWLATADPAAGFAVGQQVTIGAGSEHPETRTVVGFGSLILDAPLAFAHDAGEVVVVTRVVVTTAASAPAAPTTATASPTVGVLPATGSSSGGLVAGAGLLVVLGGALLAAATRTRRRGWGSVRVG